MNTAADRDRRQLIGATRGRDLYWGFTIAIFGNLFTLNLISQGGDLPQLALTAAIAGMFVFAAAGVVAGPAHQYFVGCL